MPRRPSTLVAAVLLACAVAVRAEEIDRRRVVAELLARSRLLDDVRFRVPLSLYKRFRRETLGQRPPAETAPLPFIAAEGVYHLRVEAGKPARLEAAVRCRIFSPRTCRSLAVLSAERVWRNVALNGKPADLATVDGWLRLSPAAPGAYVVSADAPVPQAGGRGGRLELPVLRTARTILHFDSPQAWEVFVAGGAGAIRGSDRRGTHGMLARSPRERLSVSWRRPRPPSRQPARYQIRGDVAWNLDVATQQVTARLDLAILAGRSERIDLLLPAGAERVSVAGPDVREVQAAAGAASVFLRGEVLGQTRLTVRFEQAVAKTAARRLGRLTVRDGAWAGGTLVVSNTAGSQEVLADATTGLKAMALSDVPASASSILAGPAVLAFDIAARRWSADLEVVDLAAFALQESIADLAHYEIALARDGAVMCKAAYEVRNRAKQFLRVELPAGGRVLLARVNEKPCPLTHLDGGRAVLLPLVRSKASIKGLVSFPVEIVAIYRTAALGSRGKARLALPRVDLPIAYAWCEAYVPQALRARAWSGPMRAVEQFSSEVATAHLEYGRGELAEGYEAAARPTVAAVRERRREADEPAAPQAATTQPAGDRPTPLASHALLPDVDKGRVQVDLFRNYWRAGRGLYERGDYTAAAANLRRVMELAPKSNEARNAERLLANIDMVRGKLALKSRAEKAAGAKVRWDVQAKLQPLAERQRVLLERGQQAARAGRQEEAQRQLQAAQALGQELIRQGAAPREQASRLRVAQEYLGRIARQQEGELGGLRKRVDELKRRGNYEEALKLARTIQERRGLGLAVMADDRANLGDFELDGRWGKRLAEEQKQLEALAVQAAKQRAEKERLAKTAEELRAELARKREQVLSLSGMMDDAGGLDAGLERRLKDLQRREETTEDVLKGPVTPQLVERLRHDLNTRKGVLADLTGKIAELKRVRERRDERTGTRVGVAGIPEKARDRVDFDSFITPAPPGVQRAHGTTGERPAPSRQSVSFRLRHADSHALARTVRSFLRDRARAAGDQDADGEVTVQAGGAPGTLVVTAAPETVKLVTALIKGLDAPAGTDSSLMRRFRQRGWTAPSPPVEFSIGFGLRGFDKALRRSSEALAGVKKAQDFDKAASEARAAKNFLEVNKSLFTPAQHRQRSAQVDKQLEQIERQRTAWHRKQFLRMQGRPPVSEGQRPRFTEMHRREVVEQLKREAKGLRDQGRYEEAIRFMERILELDPRDHWAADWKGWLERAVVGRPYRGEDEVTDVRQAEIPWHPVLRYPRDWKEITARRGAEGRGGEARQDDVVRWRLQMKPIAKVEFADGELKDVLAYLRDVTGLNLHVRWNALRTIGIGPKTQVTLKLQEATAEQTLRALLGSIGANRLGYRIHDGIISISTKADLARRAPAAQPQAPGREESPQERALREKLQAKVAKLDFFDIELKDVIAFLRDVTGLTIQVRWNALARAGVDKSARVDLLLVQVSAGAALQAILDGVSKPGKPLGYAVTGGQVLVSTREDLARPRTVRVYDVRDMVVRVPNFRGPRIELSERGPAGKRVGVFEDEAEAVKEQLKGRAELVRDIQTLIRETVDPTSWRLAGGETSAMRELHGQLVITTTPDNHKAIADLVAQLREARGPQVLAGVNIAQQRAAGLVGGGQAAAGQPPAGRAQVPPSAAPDASADPALRRFIDANYSWQWQRPRDPARTTTPLRRRPDGGFLYSREDLAATLGANWGQKVAVSSVNASLPAAAAETLGVRFNDGNNDVRYAVIDEAQFRTLMQMRARVRGRAPRAYESESNRQEAIVGTDALLANGWTANVRFASDRGNTIDILDNPIALPHEKYVLIDNGSYLTAVRAGEMRHWTQAVREQQLVEVPEQIDVPRAGREVKLEKTLVRPTDELVLQAEYTWQGD